MKTKKTTFAAYVNILMILALIIPVSILAARTLEKQSPPKVDVLLERADSMTKDLDLTEFQKSAVLVILEEEQRQTALDREKFENDALLLVKAAYERRENTNKRIAEILKPDQVEAFSNINRWTPFKRELFELTEGLMLTDMQSFDVEGILIEHKNRLTEMMPAEMMPEGMPGGIEKGEMPDNMRGGPRPGNPRKRMNSKKYRAIKKILKKNQLTLYKQLLADRKEKMKELRKNEPGEPIRNRG